MEWSESTARSGGSAPVVLVAFDGWSDAGDAASAALDHLLLAWDAEEQHVIDAEFYNDYQANRPVVMIDDDGSRHVEWPHTRIYLARPPGVDRDVLLVRGVEPSLRWRSFTADVLDRLQEHGPGLVVALGSMLSDVPHTRPLPVSTTSASESLMAQLALEPSHYEGETGILEVLLDAAQRRAMDCLSLWVAVPNYVSQSTCPKAVLALLDRVEQLLSVDTDAGEVADDARAWEATVTELAAEDADISDYVTHLEAESVADQLPQVSGESIARDIERFLRRRGGASPTVELDEPAAAATPAATAPATGEQQSARKQRSPGEKKSAGQNGVDGGDAAPQADSPTGSAARKPVVPKPPAVPKPPGVPKPQTGTDTAGGTGRGSAAGPSPTPPDDPHDGCPPADN